MFLYPWGDMHSLNLGWFLLQFKDWVEKIQEYLDNGGGTSENLANVIAPVFNAANYYSTGDYVLYNNELYKANQDVNPGTWDPNAWDHCLIVDEMGSGGAGVDNVARLMIAGQYSPSFGYQKYAICRYNDKLWMCNTNLPSGGETWNASHWDEITVGAGLTGLRRSVETLSGDIATLNAALNNKENKREIIIFGDSFSDIEQTGGTDKWPYKLASRHPQIPVHNYAKGGSRIVGADNYGLNGTIGGQIATAIADTTFDHNNITDIIIMGGVNDFRTLATVNESTSSAVGNDIVNKIRGRLAPEFPNAKYIVLINNSTPASHYQYMYGKSIVNAVRRNYGCRAYSMIGWTSPLYIDSDHIHPTAAGHQQILANVEAILFGGCPKYITAITTITATSSDNKNATISLVEMFNEETVIIQCTFNITSSTTEDTQFDCDMPSANFYSLGYFPAWFVAANLVNAGLRFSQNTIKTAYNPAPSQSTQNEITGGHVTLYASPYTTGAGLGFMISNNNW